MNMPWPSENYYSHLYSLYYIILYGCSWCHPFLFLFGWNREFPTPGLSSKCGVYCRRDICATVSLSTACMCVSHDDVWVYLPRLVIYLFADFFFRISSEDVTSLELWLANWAILFWHLCISAVPIGPFFSEETTHWARSSGELGWCRIYFYVPWLPLKRAKFYVNQGLVHRLVPNWIFKVSYLISAFGFV